MAKRFTDTDKWKKPFIRGLQVAYKLLWMYICDDCDHAGIWQVDIQVASIRIGEDIDTELARKAFAGKIIEIDGGDKWFIPSFIEFQYPSGLNPDNKAHSGVISLLRKFNLIDQEFKIKPLPSTLQGAMDMDMVKDMELVKEKETEKKQKPFPDCLDDIKPEKQKPEPVTLENPFGKEFHQTHWQSWKIYRTQTLKKPVKPGSEAAALKELWDDSGGDAKVAEKMIRKSIANGYQGLFPVGKTNGSKPQTANQQIHDLANNGVFLKPPPDKFVEVIQADGQRFTGNLELDNGLIVFVKAGRTRVTIDPQNNFHASCTYQLAPGRTIKEVYEYLINEQMELV